MGTVSIKCQLPIHFLRNRIFQKKIQMYKVCWDAAEKKEEKKPCMENLYVNHLALVPKQNKVIQKEKGKCHARGWNDASVSTEWSRVQRLESLAHVGEWTAREAFRSARLEAAVLYGTCFFSHSARGQPALRPGLREFSQNTIKTMLYRSPPR